MVNNNPRAAAHANRVLFLRDGQIQHDISFEPGQDMDQRLHVLISTVEQLQS